MKAGLFQKTSLIALWQLIRAAAQAVWMVLLARALGPADYGQLAGLAGLATTIGALSGIGLGLLMLQQASRDRTTFTRTWANALALTVVSGLGLTLAYPAIADFALNTTPDWMALTLLATAEIICFPITIIASYAFQAHDKMGRAGAMYALAPAGNLVALACFTIGDGPATLQAYLPYHGAAAVVSALLAVLIVQIGLRPGALKPDIRRGDLSIGTSLTAMRLADTGLSSIDKTLVLKLAGSEVAGIYTSAYRIVAVLALPITAISIAALPQLFRLTSQASVHSRFPAILLGWTLLAGLATAVAAFAVSDFLPRILGPEFESSAHAARWLMFLPMLLGICATGCGVAFSKDRRTFRIIIQFSGMLLMTFLAAGLLPRYGVPGAALMLNITLALVGLALWIPNFSRRSHTQDPPSRT